MNRGFSIGKLLTYVAAAVFLFVVLFPYVWMGATSIQVEIDVYKMPPFPFREVAFTTEYYGRLFTYSPFVQAIGNSAIVAVMTTAFVMTAGSLGAYAMARMRFKGNKILLQAVVLFYMLPGVAMLIPAIVVLRTIGLMDTLLGVMLGHSIFVLPLMTWMLTGIFASVPPDIEEAAQIDGRTRIGVLFRIIFPLTITGVALVTVFTFIISWNELMFSSVIAVRNFKMLQPVILELMGPIRTPVPQIAASGVISSLPVIVLAVVLQRYIIRGIMRGAIK
ncbi:MAG: carbohydrate ABC transporter permease [Candidatus Bathyarchaeia archaeon]